MWIIFFLQPFSDLQIQVVPQSEYKLQRTCLNMILFPYIIFSLLHIKFSERSTAEPCRRTIKLYHHSLATRNKGEAKRKFRLQNPYIHKSHICHIRHLKLDYQELLNDQCENQFTFYFLHMPYRELPLY